MLDFQKFSFFFGIYRKKMGENANTSKVSGKFCEDEAKQKQTFYSRFVSKSVANRDVLIYSHLA